MKCKLAFVFLFIMTVTGCGGSGSGEQPANQTTTTQTVTNGDADYHLSIVVTAGNSSVITNNSYVTANTSITSNLQLTATDRTDLDSIEMTCLINGQEQALQLLPNTTNAAEQNYRFVVDTATSLFANDGIYTTTCHAIDTADSQTIGSAAITKILDRVAPLITNISVANNAVLSGTVDISAQMSDVTAGINSVVYELNGTRLNGVSASNPYALSFDSTQFSNGSYSLAIIATDLAGHVTTSMRAISIANSTTAYVRFTNPVQSGDVWGNNFKLSVDAAHPAGIAGITYQLDGANIGTEVTAPPYEQLLNVRSRDNGPVTLTVIMRPQDSSQSITANISATINNSAVINVKGVNYDLAPPPRLFTRDDNTLAVLRAKANSSNKYWSWLETYMVNERTSNPSYTGKTRNSRDTHMMFNHAMLYLINPTAYADHGLAAKELLLNYTVPGYYDTSCNAPGNCTGNPNIDYGRAVMRKMAATYDWTRDLFSAEEKRVFFTWINDELFPLLHSHPQNGSPLHNLHHTHLTALLEFSLATYNDNSPSANYTVRTTGTPLNDSHDYFNWAVNSWIDEVKPEVDKYYVGGHSWSGSAYGHNRTWRYMLYNMVFLNSSLGLNQWDDSPWADDIIDYFIHTHLPGTKNGMYSDGNVGGGWWDSRLLEPLLLSINKFKNTQKGKEGQYFIDTVVRPTDQSSTNDLYVNPYYLAKWFMWGTPDGESLDYTQTAATAHLSSGVDLFQARTEWGNPNATWLGFSAAEWIGDHQGKNYGSYKIWKNGRLLYENGPDGNGMEHANNIITLDDGVVKRWYGQAVTTGGLQYTGDKQAATSYLLQADIPIAHSDDRINFARGDLAGVYVDTTAQGTRSGMKKLNNYTRDIVNLKPMVSNGNDYTIVVDKLESVPGAGTDNNIVNGQEVAKTAYLHFPNQPTLNNNVIENVELNLNSKMYTTVVVPEAPVITFTDITAEKTSGPGLGGDDVWRAEIRAVTPSVYDTFILVHFPTTDLGRANPSISALNAEANNMQNMKGVFINDSLNPRIFLTNRTENGDTLQTEATYTQHYSSSFLGHHTLSGLAVGNYEVYKDSALIHAASVDSTQLLQFDTYGGGEFVVMLVL